MKKLTALYILMMSYVLTFVTTFSYIWTSDIFNQIRITQIYLVLTILFFILMQFILKLYFRYYQLNEITYGLLYSAVFLFSVAALLHVILSKMVQVSNAYAILILLAFGICTIINIAVDILHSKGGKRSNARIIWISLLYYFLLVIITFISSTLFGIYVFGISWG